MKPYFLTESSKDFKETTTIGGFTNGSTMNSFDSVFTEAYNYLNANGTDVILDINSFIKNDAKMESYKKFLLDNLKTECENMSDDVDGVYGVRPKLYEQISTMFENCREDLITESTRTGQLLPIKAVDFPILIKQQLKLATKDIMQTEVTKTPIVKKHIEQTYIIDKSQADKKWKYPQCFFDNSYKEIFEAGKGLPIKNTPVTLPAMNYNIVEQLTDAADASVENYTMDLKIVKAIVTVGSEDVEIVLNPAMRINLSDNTWLGGRIQKTVKNTTGETLKVDDLISGMADPAQHTVILSSANGQIKSVVFSGYLSNERNTRQVTWDYAREEREWKIDDGARADASYSLEQLEDAKALLDVDLYKKTYNNLTDYLVQMEDSQVLSWLDEQFDLFKGIEVNPLDWEGFITETVFDCDSTSITTALPSEYIEKMLKFKIDRLIIDIADKAKLEDMTFVIYGNPRLISLLNPVINWVTRPGSTSNGVKLDYGYGIMTSGDIKVQVVSTKKVNTSYDDGEKIYKGLRIIPFPISEEQFTFKHYKYTTHVLTSQNSAYRDPSMPGGSQTYIVGVSRYTNAAIQGIQAQVNIAGAEQYITM